jgi:hypothetical protein
MAHLPDVAHGRLEIQAGRPSSLGPASTRSLGTINELRGKQRGVVSPRVTDGAGRQDARSDRVSMADA